MSPNIRVPFEGGSEFQLQSALEGRALINGLTRICAGLGSAQWALKCYYFDLGCFFYSKVHLVQETKDH